jgi:hypothetical protein
MQLWCDLQNAFHSVSSITSSIWQQQAPHRPKDPQGGLGPKPYAGTNMQSDKQAARMLCPIYFEKRWDSIGHAFHCFWAALLLSPINASPMYLFETGDMYFNVMTAYYMACSNVAMLEKKYGKAWYQHFISLKTFVNSMAFAGQFIGRLVKWVDTLPNCPDETRERICEIWFAWIKAHCRGTPMEKDTIYGRLSEIMESIPKHRQVNGHVSKSPNIFQYVRAHAMQLSVSNCFHLLLHHSTGRNLSNRIPMPFVTILSRCD